MKGVWEKLCGAVLEDTSTSGTKYSTLDGLRGIAVLAVFLSHSSGFRQRLTPWTSFHGCGHLGVYLFFVLSGFLLASSLLAQSSVRFGAFYLRRFFRIAPLYYLIVTIVFACQLLTGTIDVYNLHIKGGWAGYLRHLAFYQGDSVFWTIAAEFEFYFVLPFLALFLISAGKRAAMVLLLAAIAYGTWGMLIDFGTLSPGWELKVARIVHHTQYFDVFLIGILAAWLHRQRWFDEFWKRNRAGLEAASTMVGVALLGASLVCIAERFFPFHREWFPLRHVTLLYAFGFSVLTLAAMRGHALLTRILNWRWMRIVGVTGFSWYLVHFPILRFSNWALHHAPTAGAQIPWTAIEPAKLMVSFIITSALAIILYLLVEKPFMVFSKSFMSRSRERTVAAPI